MSWDQIWPTIPGVLALIATIAKILVDRRKSKAEAADLLVDSATDLVGVLQKELTEAKIEIKNLKKRTARLETQVRELGAVPVNYK